MNNPTTNYLGDVVADMPEVSPVAATLAEKAKNENAEKNPIGQIQGTEKRGRGRPRKDNAPKSPQKAKNVSRLGGVQTQEQLDNAAIDAERLATAGFITGCIEVSGALLTNDKVGKMGDVEKINMTAVWEKYLRAKGVSDMPPAMAVCLCMTQYYGRVLATPEAEPQVKKIKTWVKNKTGFLTGYFKGRKNARSMRGHDNERENDARKTDGERVQSAGNKDSGSGPSV